MGFATGSMSFRRFAVLGKSPKAPEQHLIDQLAAHALKSSEFGVPEEIEYGWSGGQHLYDANFSFDHNVYGDAVYFALRIDTNRTPGEIRKAYTLMEEQAVAATNPSGFISKNQKKDVKESVRQKMDEELRSGRIRRSKLLPVLWDVAEKVLYCPATGGAFEKLSELFERSFGLELAPLSAGSLALRMLEPRSKRRDYEDLRPTRFVIGPEGESVHPEYPWVAKGPEPKDFLGNEFLLWLWHEADARNGQISAGDAGQVTVYFDRSLDLDCAYGQTGRDGLRGDGPSRMPEARDGLRTGKLPRKAGLVMEVARQQYSLTLGAEGLGVSSLKLPQIEEAENERQVFEERITLLRDFCAGIDGLFDTFLKTRASAAWEGQVTSIRRWIVSAAKNVAA